MPARPIRIYLVRHGQSEANLDKTVNARLPDHHVALSPEGVRQAEAAGKFLADALTAGARLRILCSPYVRARQTGAAIEAELTRAGFTFDTREAIELRELQFGLFDGIADEDLPRLFPREYEHYEKHKQFAGEFFAPMPLGESRCNVADRVKGVFGTILRDASADRPNPISDFIVVSHGVTIHAVDAIFVGMVRAGEEPRQLLGATHRRRRRRLLRPAGVRRFSSARAVDTDEARRGSRRRLTRREIAEP
jgi:broad specificity phosphatase PhoE